MTEELEVQKTPKKINISALVSLVSGVLSYILLFFHSLIDIKLGLALFLAPITALIAIFVGARAKKLIRRSDGLIGGKKMANTGLWLGWIYIIVTILLIVLAVTIFGSLVSGLNSLFGSIGIG
ncbi:MAG: hypothetical protein CVU43_13090 [Chloroflexi bacterium HGW-Chloroflexi-5]|jgi:hypothetical protein|nr:MAG: hypothetical protein CVU43_13090 [Chloroflexi bacterium HGW-Chloroflexi-5]